MRKKGRNNAARALILCLLAWVALGVLYSVPAHAVGVHDNYPLLIHPQNNEICPIDYYNPADPIAKQANRQKYGIVKRIVTCVQALVIPATYHIMYEFSVNYIYSTIALACTLAVLFWGWLMVVGKNSAPMRDSFMVALKIGAVSFFTYVLGQSAIWPDGLFPVMIAITDDLARIVTSYIGYSTTMKCAANFAPADIWGRVDCAMNTLFGGIFNPAMLMAGLVGFFFSCIFSGAIGLFIALFGFATIFFLMMAILRATYITITAYVALALMAIISPIFITMILFKSTFGYFEKWLKLTMGFMLQPMFLFAYMAMMLAAFDTVVYDGRFSIYRAILGPQVMGTYPGNFPVYPQNIITNPYSDFLMGNWLFDNGIYQESSAAPVGVGTNPRLDAHIAATHTGIGGDMGLKSTQEGLYNQRNAAGIGLSVLDNFQAINIYKLDIPMKQISWLQLAGIFYDQNTATLTEDEKDTLMLNYIIQLLLSLLIAVITIYLFYIMIDMLPFIGAGISGERYSMPMMGSNGLSMPGNKLLDKMKSGMSALAGGGK